MNSQAHWHDFGFDLILYEWRLIEVDWWAHHNWLALHDHTYFIVQTHNPCGTPTQPQGHLLLLVPLHVVLLLLCQCLLSMSDSVTAIVDGGRPHPPSLRPCQCSVLLEQRGSLNASRYTDPVGLMRAALQHWCVLTRKHSGGLRPHWLSVCVRVCGLWCHPANSGADDLYQPACWSAAGRQQLTSRTGTSS